MKIAGETMRFILIDKVVSLDPGRHITAVKGLSLAEEYLKDHFPTFPVLPGVFLLQGLVESASWLVRETQQFAHSMVLLEQTRNVKYRSFLAPGMQITYTVDAKKLDDKISDFTGYGESNGQRIVEARLALRHFNLAEKNKALADADTEIIDALQQRWHLLRPSIETTRH